MNIPNDIGEKVSKIICYAHTIVTEQNINQYYYENTSDNRMLIIRKHNKFDVFITVCNTEFHVIMGLRNSMSDEPVMISVEINIVPNGTFNEELEKY